MFRISGVLGALPVGITSSRSRSRTCDAIARQRARKSQSSAEEGTMNSVKFLYAAYIATWTIHAIYIGTLVRRFRHLRKERNELGTKPQ